MLPTPPPSQPEPKTPRRKRRKSRPADAAAEPMTPSTGHRSSRKKRRRTLTADPHVGGMITPTSVPATPVSAVAQTPRLLIALRGDTVESPGARELREVDEVAGLMELGAPRSGGKRRQKNDKKAGDEVHPVAENKALEAEKKVQKADKKAAKAERRAQKAEKKAVEAAKRKSRKSRESGPLPSAGISPPRAKEVARKETKRKGRESGPLSSVGISPPRAAIEEAARKETRRKKRRQNGTSSKGLSPARSTVDSTARPQRSPVDEANAMRSSAAALPDGDVLPVSPGASEVEEEGIDLALEMAAVADEDVERVEGGEGLEATHDDPPVQAPRPPRQKGTKITTNCISKSVDIIEDSDVEEEPRPTAERTVGGAKRTAKSRLPREPKPQFSFDELRTILTTLAAVNDFLASRWLEAADLKPLEAAGLITVKRGKFTEEERTSIRNYLDTFQKRNRLTNADLVEIIMAKRQHPSRTKYPDLWSELAAELPGRPLGNVKRATQRLYDPRARKGAWLPTEDAALLRAYNHTPNQWSKIALVVERTETDCRDRWRNELRDRASRNTGPWKDDEVKRLVDAVAQANAKLGYAPDSADVPWDEVVKLMGWTRTRTQCRKKWQDELRFKHSRPIVDYPAEKLRLIKRLRELGYKHECDIQWAQLPTPQWNLSPAQLRFRWRDMKNSLNAKEGLPFNELLDKLEIMVRKQKNHKRRMRGDADTSDEDDEPVDDNEGGEGESDEDDIGDERGGADENDSADEDGGSEDGHVDVEYESEEG